MYFDFDFSCLTICLLASAFVVALYVGCVYCVRVLAVGKRQRAADKTDYAAPILNIDYPTVSIIVYAHSDPEALSKNLPLMMEQVYPGRFEAIVVNEGMSADVNMAVALVKSKYPNIYLTFTPDEARNLSRRKLGLTLGVKAAKGSIVVITDARATVSSTDWLRLMVEPMIEDASKEIVLGYGYPSLPDDAGYLAKRRAFDMAADSVTWISAAMHGHPYRACAYNLAYKKQLFFDAKGFAGSINMKDGDDDAFVSVIADSDNTALQLSADAIAALDLTPYMRLSADDRKSHAFTGRHLYKGERLLMASGSWGIWASAALAVAGALTAGLCNGAGWAIAAAIIIAVAVTVGLCWRMTLKALRVPSIAILLPWIAATRPLRNIWIAIASRTSHRHYIWQ